MKPLIYKFIIQIGLNSKYCMESIYITHLCIIERVHLYRFKIMSFGKLYMYGHGKRFQ